MDKDDIKNIDLEEEEDLGFIKKKKGRGFKDDEEEIVGGIKDPLDDDFIDDEEVLDDEEEGYYLNEDGEEADEWDDVYGYKDEYES
jgi:hypothetical protein